MEPLEICPTSGGQFKPGAIHVDKAANGKVPYLSASGCSSTYPALRFWQPVPKGPEFKIANKLACLRKLDEEAVKD